MPTINKTNPRGFIVIDWIYILHFLKLISIRHIFLNIKIDIHYYFENTDNYFLFFIFFQLTLNLKSFSKQMNLNTFVKYIYIHEIRKNYNQNDELNIHVKK